MPTLSSTKNFATAVHTTESEFSKMVKLKVVEQHQLEYTQLLVAGFGQWCLHFQWKKNATFFFPNSKTCVHAHVRHKDLKLKLAPGGDAIVWCCVNDRTYRQESSTGFWKYANMGPQLQSCPRQHWVADEKAGEGSGLAIFLQARLRHT